MRCALLVTSCLAMVMRALGENLTAPPTFHAAFDGTAGLA